MIVDASLVIDAVADPGPLGAAGREVLANQLANQPAAEPLIAPGHFAFEIMSALRAAAERHGTAVPTTDTRIERSGAPMTCPIITVHVPA